MTGIIWSFQPKLARPCSHTQHIISGLSSDPLPSFQLTQTRQGMLSTAVPAQRRTEQSLAREKVKAALTDFQIKEQSLKKQ